MNIRISSPLLFDSIVDGPGLRCVLWVQGCMHQCPGCHNQKALPMNGGMVVDTDILIAQMNQSHMQSGLTLSGGEPFLQCAPLIEVVEALKQKHWNIWAYSGFMYEELLENKTQFELLKRVDVLVDGTFILELKAFDLKFKGSRNQRIIDVQASLAKGEVVLWKENKTSE